MEQEISRVAVVGNVGEQTLTRLAEDLREDFASQPYISKVGLFGARKEEVTVELSELALRRYNLTFAEVAAAIRANSINLSSGQVRTGTGDIQLRVLNLADSESDFGSIIIRQTAEGAVIRLRDVAKVIDGFEEQDILATLNGVPAILLQVQSADQMQVVKSSESTKRWIDQVNDRLPSGVRVELWFDTADIYTSRMDLIAESSDKAINKEVIYF